jgi:hypothetical protein
MFEENILTPDKEEFLLSDIKKDEWPDLPVDKKNKDKIVPTNLSLLTTAAMGTDF